MMNQTNGRREIITNTVNFGVEKPFSDFSMTLQTLKKEKHEKWLVKKQEKTQQINHHIKEMEKKLDVYTQYRNDYGVEFSKTERDKVLRKFDTTGVEIMVGRKMFL